MNRVGAETAVIGACMIDAQAYWKVADMLVTEDFAQPHLRALWDEIAALKKAGKETDWISIGESKSGLADTARDIANGSFFSANVRGYAEWVLADAMQRKVVAAGQRIAKLSGADCIGEAQRILSTCQPRALSAVRSIASFLDDSINIMQERCDSAEDLTGVATSLEWLDETTSGWQRGDLIIFAARPSVGKTALAIQAALYAAEKTHPVFFASLEQSGSQISERALSYLSGVPLKHIMQPKLIEPQEWELITKAAEKLRHLPIMIDESGGLTVEAIGARARQVNATQRLGLIVIDYLTQIVMPKADKVADSIQIITRALKALAKELAVPVILLSQLNRDGADRPILKNLRDGGSIEQDADVVVFLHRPEETKLHLIELIVAKQRNGPIDSTYLNAQMNRMRFFPTTERPAPTKKAQGFSVTAGAAA